jgi:hypothetical protein
MTCRPAGSSKQLGLELVLEPGASRSTPRTTVASSLWLDATGLKFSSIPGGVVRMTEMLEPNQFAT